MKIQSVPGAQVYEASNPDFVCEVTMDFAACLFQLCSDYGVTFGGLVQGGSFPIRLPKKL